MSFMALTLKTTGCHLYYIHLRSDFNGVIFHKYEHRERNMKILLLRREHRNKLVLSASLSSSRKGGTDEGRFRVGRQAGPGIEEDAAPRLLPPCWRSPPWWPKGNQSGEGLPESQRAEQTPRSWSRVPCSWEEELGAEGVSGLGPDSGGSAPKPSEAT